MSISPISGNFAPSPSYSLPVSQDSSTTAPPVASPGIGFQTAAAPPVKDVTQSNSGNKEALKDAVKKVNDFVTSQTSDVQFLIDESTHIHVVKVVDVATQDVIRQIPSEEILQLAKSLDRLQGLIVRQKA